METETCIFFSDHYFTSVSWLNANSFFIVWTNRLQNLSVISLCQAPNYECQGVSSLFELFKTSVGYPALPGTISQYNCEIVPCRLI